MEESWLNWNAREKVWRRNYKTLWVVPCYLTEYDYHKVPNVAIRRRIFKALEMEGIAVIEVKSICEDTIYILTQETKKIS